MEHTSPLCRIIVYRNHSHVKDVPYFIQYLIHTSVVLNLVPVYQLSSYPVSGLPVENWGWGWGRMLRSTSCDVDLRLHPKGACPALRGPCVHTVPCPKAGTPAVVWYSPRCPAHPITWLYTGALHRLKEVPVPWILRVGLARR